MVIITYYFDLQIKESIEVQKCYITVIWTTSKRVLYTNEFSQLSLMRSNRRRVCEQSRGKVDESSCGERKKNKVSTCALCIGVRRDQDSTRVQLQEPSAQDVLPEEEFSPLSFLEACNKKQNLRLQKGKQREGAAFHLNSSSEALKKDLKYTKWILAGEIGESRNTEFVFPSQYGSFNVKTQAHLCT